MKTRYYLCTFTNMGCGKKVIETTIVRGIDKTDAGFRAMRKMRRTVGLECARFWDLWSTKEIETTF